MESQHSVFAANMLQDRYKAMVALAILVTWQMAGYMMLIYTTGLNNIPTDLSEAAAIDGAKRIPEIPLYHDPDADAVLHYRIFPDSVQMLHVAGPQRSPDRW